MSEKSELDPQISKAFAHRFFPRHDIHAEQLKDRRGYILKEEPVTEGLLNAHFRGEKTLGTYCLSKTNKAYFVALDVDRDDVWLGVKASINQLSVPTYIEQSRRGGHLWFFFEKALAGSKVRLFARAVIEQLAIVGVEIYPKQDEIGEGVGSLIRLPLGIHWHADPPKRFVFQTVEGEPLAPTVREQIAILSSPECVPHAVLEQLILEQLKLRSPRRRSPRMLRPRPTLENAPLSERIKKAVTVRGFVVEYVDLSERGMGLCPFHDDHNPSFGVNEAKNYWSCYAGCGGGSVIDFWMLYRSEVLHQDGSFTATIKDLADMLGL